jgi:transcription antitermination factor NusA-like protein
MADDTLKIICSALGNIEPTQVTFKRDPSTGTMVAKVELRPQQLAGALRENGRFVREAAMRTGIDIDVGMAAA